MDRSLHTKIALGQAFREVLEEKPFSKIIVSDISDRAGMSRKSFYYHFKDKYDVVNWLFRREFETLLEESDARGWEVPEKLVYYLGTRPGYYEQMLRITGQNCFSEYLCTYVRELLKKEESLGAKSSFLCEVWADAFVAALKCWLLQYSKLTPEEVCAMLKPMFCSAFPANEGTERHYTT